MTTLRTAAQQALEALELAQTDVHWELNSPTRKFLRKAEKNLRAALAEPEPFNPDWDRIEPLQENLREHMVEIQRLRSELALQRFTDVNQELEAALAEPDEPVAWLWQHRETGRTRVLMPDERTATDVAAAWDVVGPLYLAPPQRKPLTDEEIDHAANNIFTDDPVQWWRQLARTIERAHEIT